MPMIVKPEHGYSLKWDGRKDGVSVPAPFVKWLGAEGQFGSTSKTNFIEFHTKCVCHTKAPSCFCRSMALPGARHAMINL